MRYGAGTDAMTSKATVGNQSFGSAACEKATTSFSEPESPLRSCVFHLLTPNEKILHFIKIHAVSKTLSTIFIGMILREKVGKGAWFRCQWAVKVSMALERKVLSERFVPEHVGWRD